VLMVYCLQTRVKELKSGMLKVKIKFVEAEVTVKLGLSLWSSSAGVHI